MKLNCSNKSQILILTARVLFLTVSLGLAVPAILTASISKASNAMEIDPIYIDSDYTLDSDLTFKKDGFIIMADDITLDLNGHTITGNGEGKSVVLEGRTGVTVKNGIIENFNTGITLNEGSGNIITGNTVSNNSIFAFVLSNSSGNTFIGNTATQNKYGFYLDVSNGNTFTENTVTNNTDGFKLRESIGNTITGNTVLDNEIVGFYLYRSSDNNTLTGNTVTHNRHSGFHLEESSNNTLTGNTVTHNDNFGLYLKGFYQRKSCDGNTIYNNYFDNNNNAYDGGSNMWNIAKASGTNIIGGPYLGGNYFSDYHGKDANGDGIGDTPYEILGGANQDSLPLVKPQPTATTTTTSLTPVGAFPILGGPIGILLATLLLLLAMYPMRRRKRKAR